MTRQIINIGSGNLTGDGESIRSAFDKSNKNFEELFSLTNFNSVTSNIIPSEDEVYDLGSPTNKWKSLYISSSTIYFNSTPLTVRNNTIIIGTGSEQISFATENFVIQQIANIVESDTVFSSSTAASITATDVTNWNAAYSWGDHNAAGYQIFDQSLNTTDNPQFNRVGLTAGEINVVQGTDFNVFVSPDGNIAYNLTLSTSSGSLTITGQMNANAYNLTSVGSVGYSGSDLLLSANTGNVILNAGGEIGQYVTLDTDGDFTVPNYVKFKGNTFIGDEPGFGNPAFRIVAPLGYGATIETDSDIEGSSWTWTFGSDGTLGAPGDVTAVNFIGNGSQLTGLPVSTAITNGTSTISIPVPGGSIYVGVNNVGSTEFTANGINTLNLNVSANGTLSVGIGGSITLPSGSLKPDATDGFLTIEGPLYADMVQEEGGGVRTITNGVKIRTHRAFDDVNHDWNFSWDGSIYAPRDASNNQVGAIEWRTGNIITQVRRTEGGTLPSGRVIPAGQMIFANNTGGVSVLTGNSNYWTFEADGSLTFPNNTVQTTAFSTSSIEILNPNINYINNIIGTSFSIDNDLILVGHYRNDNNTGTCYIYDIPTLTLLRTIDNPAPITNDFFGLEVGLYNNDAYILGSGKGIVYNYNITNGNLNYQIQLSGELTGIRLTLTDQYIIISQPEKTHRGSPLGTLWNSDLGDGTGWNDLTNVKDRNYTTFVLANDYAIGDNVIGSLFIMKDTINNKYYKIEFDSWTQGGAGGGFSYTRQQIDEITGADIGSLVSFTKTDYGSEIDAIDTSISITRGVSQSIYNPVLEPSYLDTYDNEGVVYVYNRITGDLIYTLFEPDFYDPTSISGQYKYLFGQNIKYHNNYLIISSTSGDDNTLTDGLLYVYDIRLFTATNGIITSQPINILSNPNYYASNDGYDNFGSSIDINEQYIIVSAPSETDQNSTPSAGVIYVYDRTQLNTDIITSSSYIILNPNLSGTATGDSLGLSLSLHNDFIIAGTGDGVNLVYIYDINKFSSTTITDPNYIVPNRSDIESAINYTSKVYKNYLFASETEVNTNFENINIFKFDITTSTRIESISDINVNSVTFDSGVNFKMVPAPASNLGTSTDVAGLFAADDGYFYYCVANYDGDTSIWRRMPWNSSSDTWPQQA